MPSTRCQQRQGRYKHKLGRDGCHNLQIWADAQNDRDWKLCMRAMKCNVRGNNCTARKVKKGINGSQAKMLNYQPRSLYR
eukprot:4256606-Pleurochrysis_carterae.AAC.1